MKRVKATFLAGVVVTFGLIGVAVSQNPEKKGSGKEPAGAAMGEAAAAVALDGMGADKKAEMDAMMGMMPKAGKEHEWLKKSAGDWDADCVMIMGPGQETKSKMTESVRMMGDFWAIVETKGDMMGMPFYGHGVYGYDQIKKKYIGTWCDSMSSSLLLSEGNFDAEGKVLTMTGEGPDMTMSGFVTYTMKSWFEGDDKHVFEMWIPGPDKQPMKCMTITYHRKK